MSDLLEQAIAAHGGLERWNDFTEVTATMLGGGGLWPMKGFEPAPIPTDVTVTLHEENSSISPFGRPDSNLTRMHVNLMYIPSSISHAQPRL